MLVAVWNDLFSRGTKLDVPEQVVQNAWRALIAGNYTIASGNRMNYSAGNAYDHLYEAECGDAVRSLLHFGQIADAKKMIGPLLDFDRKATRFHVAGHKLQLLADYYWLTRDKGFIEEAANEMGSGGGLHPRRSPETNNGLLPKDNYRRRCEDAGLFTQLQCELLARPAPTWPAVLEDAGAKDQAAELRKEADAFRKVILDAVGKSIRRRRSSSR